MSKNSGLQGSSPRAAERRGKNQKRQLIEQLEKGLVLYRAPVSIRRPLSFKAGAMGTEKGRQNGLRKHENGVRSRTVYNISHIIGKCKSNSEEKAKKKEN